MSFEVGIKASLAKKVILGQRIGRDRVSLHTSEGRASRENSQCRGPEAKWRAEERVQRCIREARKGCDQGYRCAHALMGTQGHRNR